MKRSKDLKKRWKYLRHGWPTMSLKEFARKQAEYVLDQDNVSDIHELAMAWLEAKRE